MDAEPTDPGPYEYFVQIRFMADNADHAKFVVDSIQDDNDFVQVDVLCRVGEEVGSTT